MDTRSTTRARRVAVILAVLSSLVVTACSPTQPDNVDTSTPKAAVCDNTLPGPSAPPPDAVVVDPAIIGDLADKTATNPQGTTFWIAPGTHRLNDHRYAQIVPKDGNTYLGAPGAVFDGRKINHYAFVGQARDVAIRHLTVQGFIAPPNQGVVNHDSGDSWVIEHSTIQRNGGAGMMAGARQQVRGNCLRDNGQYAMNAFKAGNSISDLVVEGNEIVGNNTDDWENKRPGCGCTGAIKFWAVDGADVRGNWIHDNRGIALWADTNNNDFLIEKNIIENNDGSAIFYEVSYNATIRDNLLRRNNWVAGKQFADGGDTFPVATIYLSEAGGEPRVPARTDKIEIHDNVLEDNWSGITLWENADRFCNSPANTSSGSCTPLATDATRCSKKHITEDKFYRDCRWKTQRVEIHHNRFSLDPEVVECTSMCGRMAILSNFGTYPTWSPYQRDAIKEAITFDQQNHWHHNAYTGPWTFMPYDTGRLVDRAE